MVDSNKLRGAIYERCNSKSEFADKLGWSKQKLNWVLRHPERMRLDQVREMILALNLDGDITAANIFLPIAFK